MFTSGQITFAISFLVIFIIGMIWSYRKERKVSKIHYKKTYLILLALLLFVSVLFFIVKIKKYL